jgi:hypothetical protein
MDWVEELVSQKLSSILDLHPEDRAFMRLAALAVEADSKRSKKDARRQVKDAFHTGLKQYIAGGNAPRNREHTEEILHRHRRVDGLALPLDAESRRRVSGESGAGVLVLRLGRAHLRPSSKISRTHNDRGDLQTHVGVLRRTGLPRSS